VSRGNTITGTASAVIQSAEIGLSRVHPVSSGSVLVKIYRLLTYSPLTPQISGTDLGSRSQKRNAKQTIGTDYASNLEINYLNIQLKVFLA
jgi:hypothetical protein